MDSVKEIFLALMILFGGGQITKKVHDYFKQMAVIQIQTGLPSMSHFTHNLIKWSKYFLPLLNQQ